MQTSHNRMRRLMFACLLAFASPLAWAGSWNPFVLQGIVSPAPLLPVEFNGTGVLSFNVGNTGSDALPLVTNQEMTLVITLSAGIPNNVDPLAALGGTWLNKFNWTYEASNTTYRAVQNQALPGSDLGTITIQYQVTRNTSVTEAINGCNVNLQPPPYSNGYNTTDDDAVSSYTYVRATDYGDAPSSYGSAVHDINVFQDLDVDTGLWYYQNYVYLGSYVDPETTNQPSTHADADDTSRTGGLSVNDEDGVTYPTLIAGASATITAVVTMRDVSHGQVAYLNGWIDWNGDGDFTDSGERIVSNRLVLDSGSQSITITVPANAITTRPTFARFRFGSSLTGPTATAAYGEVEDYEITLQPQRVTVGDRVWEDMNGNGVQDAGEPGLTNVTVRLLDATNGVVAASATDATGAYRFANLPPATYQVEFVAPAQHVFTVRDAAITNDLADSDADRVTGRTAPVVMAAGTTNLTLDAGLYVPAVLYGYLFVDKNTDLVRNTGDWAVTNALVRLVVNGTVVASANSNTNGYYYFANVPPGAVSVLVSRASSTLIGLPDSTDVMRNRALPDAQGFDAYVPYSVLSGYGVLSAGEPLNFGFSTSPLSTAMDISVYATKDGVMIELWTNNESGYGDIVVYAWINNAWLEVGRVPGDQVVGEGSNRYLAQASGLSPDGSYFFKVVDEAGHVHFSSAPVAVETIRVGIVRMELTTLTLSFNTEPNRNYVLKVSTNLVTWANEYACYPTATGWSDYVNTAFTAVGARTEIKVPVNGRAKAFFKIERVDE